MDEERSGSGCDSGRYIFLDLDGVLNTEHYFNYRRFTAQSVTDGYGRLFDPRAVENLADVVSATGAGIVIGSTWRTEGLDCMREMWRRRSLPGEIVGVTPVADIRLHRERHGTYCGVRGAEIASWLEERAVSGCAYVIIDDVDDFLPVQGDRVVLTESYYGMTEDDARQAIGILNMPAEL